MFLFSGVLLLDTYVGGSLVTYGSLDFIALSDLVVKIFLSV